MKDQLRQMAVIVTIITTLVVNVGNCMVSEDVRQKEQFADVWFSRP